MTVPPDDSPWRDDCPARIALSHVHWSSCDVARGGHPGTGAKHAASECCECGLEPAVARRLAEIAAAEEDQALRDHVLREAGIAPDHLVDPASTPIEPKMATGKPAGPPWGRGRSWRGDGQLTPRDRGRLEKLANFYAWLPDGGS